MRLFALALCFVALIAVGQALECYTGWAIIRGRSVGTTTEICKKDSDSCYRMSSDINTAMKAKLAGCSTYRCMLTRNTCLGQVRILADQNNWENLYFLVYLPFLHF